MSIALTDTTTLRPLVLPARADAAPSAEIRAYADVRNRSIRDLTGRDDDDMSAESLLPVLHSDPSFTRRQWYVADGDEMLGNVVLNIMRDDGGRTAITIISLLQRAWGRGIGSAVAEHLESCAREAGVRRLLVWTEHPASDAERLAPPTGAGSIPRDHHARFLLRHGFTLEQVERVSMLRRSDAATARLRTLHAGAAEAAPGYRTVQWLLPTPPERIDEYARMKQHMSTDVPDADLEMPAETWDAERVRHHDDRYAQRGSTVLVTAAEHIATGELCAYNELSIGPDPAAITHQEDTLVLAEHRGHRLGMLVKTAGLLTWQRLHPDSPGTITYNAEENRPMLDINEAIGFAPIAYEGAWKKELA